MQLGTGFVSRQFSYHAGDVTQEHQDNAKLKSSATTMLVSQIVLSDGRTISYEYDPEERITKVTDSLEGVTEYTYDAMGQLLTEARDGTVVNTMTYDAYGNILTKNGKVYAYGDGVWRDKLTAINGQEIVYDAQGNPTTYLGRTLIWEKGRQLKRFHNSLYAYNANGIRTSKTVNGVIHEYLLDGTNILRETWGGNTLIPLYDNEEQVCGIEYNGTPYFFLKNLQGDVIAITDANGETLVRYSYDAWGACTVLADSYVELAAVNPYRYRGYYFDTDTGLYYLQSRYYDPTTGRFINSDVVEYIDFRDSLLSKNIFAYCENSPIRYYDPSGYSTIVIIVCGVKIAIDAGALIAAAVSALAVVLIQFFRDLPKILRGLSDALEDLFNAVSAVVKKAVAARKQRTKAKHHVIAKSAWRAAPARDIWTNKLRLSINDNRNLASINQTFHYYLHTVGYYNSVNALVSLGYTKGRNGVLAVVKAIRTTLLTVSEWYF